MSDEARLDLLRKMATPTRLGVTIGKEYMGYDYQVWPWMLYAERRILAAFQRPGRSFFIINVPPQVSKTSTFGMLLSAWYLGMFPHNQVLFIAYSEEYAAGWGLKTRNLLARYGPDLFGQSVSSQQDSKTNWKMANGFGGMISVGIGGGLAGNPGHLILIDDVLKTMEDAASLAVKQKHADEYDGSIASRFQENTVVVITATRFAEDDLSGRLIERQNQPGYDGDRFEVLAFPAFAQAPDGLSDEEREAWRDVLGRKDGDHLESRHSREFYLSRRKTLEQGAKFVWDAIYQQDPSSREGGMFPVSAWKYWNIADETRPTIVRSVRVWDLAATEGGGDWTVGSKFGLGSNGDIFLLERERFRRSGGEVERKVKEVAARDGQLVKIIIEQERAGAGTATIDRYKRELAGYVVEPGKADGTKEQRAQPYSTMQNLGRVWLPGHDKTLCEEWVDEHRRMMGDGRRPRHDDQIDTGAYAVMELTEYTPGELWIPGERIYADNPEDEPAVGFDAMAGVLSGANRFFT